MPDYNSDFEAVRYADVGTALPSVSTPPIVWPSSPGAAANEKQTVTVTGSPTGGDFTLTYGSAETAAIAHNAYASEVEEALEALSSIGDGNVKVTGSAGGPFLVEFIRDLAGQNLAIMTKDASGLTGGTTPNVTIVETQAGSTGGGIWTPLPTVDGEKGVKLVAKANSKDIWPGGSVRPTSKHILQVTFEKIELQLEQSGLTAIRFAFPSFPLVGGKLQLSARNVEAPYKALAIESSAGVLEFMKTALSQESDLLLKTTDITELPVMLNTYADSNGVVGYFHPFQ
ncbi:MAG: hypothetical protein WC655_24405 [Candidatus Hydrogenedentales bacterium]|jgi:hypothetical protein